MHSLYITCLRSLGIVLNELQCRVMLCLCARVFSTETICTPYVRMGLVKIMYKKMGSSNCFCVLLVLSSPFLWVTWPLKLMTTSFTSSSWRSTRHAKGPKSSLTRMGTQGMPDAFVDWRSSHRLFWSFPVIMAMSESVSMTALWQWSRIGTSSNILKYCLILKSHICCRV